MRRLDKLHLYNFYFNMNLSFKTESLPTNLLEQSHKRDTNSDLTTVKSFFICWTANSVPFDVIVMIVILY